MWIELNENYWLHKESNWVVRDYNTQTDEEGWVILDSNKIMFSCDWLTTKEECMEIVEDMYKENLTF